ncbi:MAG TPA: serine hydrolase [Streptosporangiaceae bacterium]|nr:serine hydrolase [Streptosporangiaceae bacterium]
MALRIARAIGTAMRSRFTSRDPVYNPFANVSLEVRDVELKLSCWFHIDRQFYSASAIKATILAGLLFKAEDQHRDLTRQEKDTAWLMITRSDNDAATALWNDVGLPAMRHFLHVAGMRQTLPNTWGAWGLTVITAHDETILLRLLTSPAHVLTTAARRYELNLMNHVIASQAWGVRAGAPKRLSWHIKNGWAPLPDLTSSPWVVNSIGCFAGKSPSYSIVVLTHENPGSDPSYGIGTIESVAWAVNRGLNPGAAPVWPRVMRQLVPRVPDEALPRPPASG